MGAVIIAHHQDLIWIDWRILDDQLQEFNSILGVGLIGHEEERAELDGRPILMLISTNSSINCAACSLLALIRHNYGIIRPSLCFVISPVIDAGLIIPMDKWVFIN